MDKGRYAELHCHTNYSFKDGGSHIYEIVDRSVDLGLYAVAITDTNNLCGVIEFYKYCQHKSIKPIIGSELIIDDRFPVTILVKNHVGYKNLCRLISDSYLSSGEHNKLCLNEKALLLNTSGLICLSGDRNSRAVKLLEDNRLKELEELFQNYEKHFGAGNFFIELQQNLVSGDTFRNKKLSSIGESLGIPIVATGDVHYHSRERSRLHDILVAIKNNTNLNKAGHLRFSNDQFFLRSPVQMQKLFNFDKSAVENSLVISDQCNFDIFHKSGYQFPKFNTGDKKETPRGFLKRICNEKLTSKYPEVTDEIRERLERELDLFERHDLIGFILRYYEIIRIAKRIMLELNLINGIDDLVSPGRGRGSSVSSLVGYLIGLSHIDPIKFNLKLERFIREDMDRMPDIDIDFPREIRERLIKAIHEKWGYKKAVLTGMISTYKLKGAVRDVSKAFGVPREKMDFLLAHLDMDDLEYSNFLKGVDIRRILYFSNMLMGFPKYLAQHPGGMIFSDTDLDQVVPIQLSAIDGRYICQWDKDSISDMGFAKVDILSLGALSQINEILDLIWKNYELSIDLSKIDFNDQDVYISIHNSDTIGVFQIESAAQRQTVCRLKPTNLIEMAWEVGAVRPGVGINDGITAFINRHTGREKNWKFDHEFEREALNRTYGIPLFQDQLIELAVCVAGFSSCEADRMRRDFGRRNSNILIPIWKKTFIEGATRKGVALEVAEKIFRKFHGLYQFPESHAFAFGVTAYQLAWLKFYYPLEFYVGLINNQPMGFYNLETIKEDAKRHGVLILNPDVNLSQGISTVEEGRIRLGLKNIKGVNTEMSGRVLREKIRNGEFMSLKNFVSRVDIPKSLTSSVISSGAFDLLGKRDRKQKQWELGLIEPYYSNQKNMEFSNKESFIELKNVSSKEKMYEEYDSLGMYPKGHLMSFIRKDLGNGILKSTEIIGLKDGEKARVAGVVIRRQRPHKKKTVFLTLEDEFGHIPVVVWPDIFEDNKRVIKSHGMIVKGHISRLNGSMNLVAEEFEPITTNINFSRNWF